MSVQQIIVLGFILFNRNFLLSNIKLYVTNLFSKCSIHISNEDLTLFSPYTYLISLNNLTSPILIVFLHKVYSGLS
jgi:hypothetical protein